MTAKVTSNPQKTTSAPVRMHMSGNNKSVRGNYYFAKSLINNVRFSRHVQPIYTGADGRTVQTAHVRRTVLSRPFAWWPGVVTETKRVRQPTPTRRFAVLPTPLTAHHLIYSQFNRLHFVAETLCFAVSAPDVPPFR